ncbi:MAG TPA: retron St85 family RNA-directed DNA polymerase, partial [Polyangiales bacterium]
MTDLDRSRNVSPVELFGLPRVTSLADLAGHTRLSKGSLFRLLKAGPLAYRVFSIPKKSGGQRQIAQPGRALKAVQGWILRHVLDNLRTSAACKGFERGASVADNADPHVGAKAILCLDIEDFFPSISIRRVTWVFRLAGYDPWTALTLAQYCTIRGRLPQGSPCSPKLANLACFRLDRRLIGFCGRKGLVYTRYADDMTFSSSSPSRLAKSLPMIASIVREEGFVLNEAKTRLRGPARCRKVTGLVLAHDFVGVGRVRLRSLRAELFSTLVQHSATTTPERYRQLQGWLDYVHGVDQRRYQSLARYIGGLKRRFPA